MAKKKSRRPEPVSTERPSITPERFRRLHLLLRLVAAAPCPRDQLAKALSLDVRGFYRDLEALRAAGIVIALGDGAYSLKGKLDDALGKLPFPDPRVTLAEVVQLSRGRGKPQAALAALIAALVS